MAEFQELPPDDGKKDNISPVLVPLEEKLAELRSIKEAPPVVEEELAIYQNLIEAVRSGNESIVELANFDKLRQAKGIPSGMLGVDKNGRSMFGHSQKALAFVAEMMSGMTLEQSLAKAAAAERIRDFFEPADQEIPAREMSGEFGKFAAELSPKYNDDPQTREIEAYLLSGMEFVAQKTRFPECTLVTLRNTNRPEDKTTITQSIHIEPPAQTLQTKA